MPPQDKSKVITKKSKKYRRQIRVGSKMYQATFTRKEDADRWYSKMVLKKERIKNGIDIGFEPKVFEEWAGTWLCEKVGTIETSTFNLYNGFLKNHLLPLFKNDYLHLLSSREIEKKLILTWKNKELANGTYNRLRSLLNEIFTDAKEKRPQHVVDNPIERVRTLPESDGRETTILANLEDMQTYISGAWSLINPPFWLAVMIFLNTGARLGEALAITRADVDFLKCEININKQRVYRTGEVKPYTKGKRNRKVRINEALLAALVFWFEFDTDAGPDDYLVRWVKSPQKGRWKNDGRPFSPSHTHRLHDNLCAELKLPPMTLHALRHSYATHELYKSKDVYFVQQQLGHQDLKTSQRYFGVIERQLKNRETFSTGKEALDEIRKLKLVKA